MPITGRSTALCTDWIAANNVVQSSSENDTRSLKQIIETVEELDQCGIGFRTTHAAAYARVAFSIMRYEILTVWVEAPRL